MWLTLYDLHHALYNPIQMVNKLVLSCPSFFSNRCDGTSLWIEIEMQITKSILCDTSKGSVRTANRNSLLVAYISKVNLSWWKACFSTDRVCLLVGSRYTDNLTLNKSVCELSSKALVSCLKSVGKLSPRTVPVSCLVSELS